MKDRLKEMWLCHGVKLSLLAALCLGLALYGLLYALHQVFFLGEVFFSGLFVGLFYLYPLLLTLINFILLSQYLKFVNISPNIFLMFYIIIHKWME